MWIFKRRQKLDLLTRLLDLETRRIDHREAVEGKRDEIELRKLEIEMAHLDARTKATIELDKARAELRERRRATGRKAALKRWGKSETGDSPQCALCINPMFRAPTVAMIREHQKHEGLAEAAGPEPEKGN